MVFHEPRCEHFGRRSGIPVDEQPLGPDRFVYGHHVGRLVLIVLPEHLELHVGRQFLVGIPRRYDVVIVHILRIVLIGQQQVMGGILAERAGQGEGAADVDRLLGLWE